MAAQSRDFKLQVLLYAGVGAILWLGLVALPSINNPNYSGGYYLLGACICMLLLGTFDPKSSHLRVGLLMAAPGILLAAWTAPRGDNDGLWLLWFPLLCISSFLLAGFHWMGSIARRPHRNRHGSS